MNEYVSFYVNVVVHQPLNHTLRYHKHGQHMRLSKQTLHPVMIARTFRPTKCIRWRDRHTLHWDTYKYIYIYTHTYVKTEQWNIISFIHKYKLRAISSSGSPKQSIKQKITQPTVIFFSNCCCTILSVIFHFIDKPLIVPNEFSIDCFTLRTKDTFQFDSICRAQVANVISVEFRIVSSLDDFHIVSMERWDQ